jgi:hypothetical protein
MFMILRLGCNSLDINEREDQLFWLRYQYLPILTIRNWHSAISTHFISYAFESINCCLFERFSATKEFPNLILSYMQMHLQMIDETTLLKILSYLCLFRTFLLTLLYKEGTFAS